MVNSETKGKISTSYPVRIEVCGGIASGKTTFANLMRQIGVDAILEDFTTNPFWRAFYTDPAKYTFETEVSFLLQHYHQIKKSQADGKIHICDFSFFLDIAYAEIGLKGSQLEAFLTVYNEVRKELLPPKLLVYLNCNAKSELKRIRNRGRTVEDTINTDFLQTLNDAVECQVINSTKNLKVISIDSTQKDFANNETVQQEMTEIIKKTLEENRKEEKGSSLHLTA